MHLYLECMHSHTRIFNTISNKIDVLITSSIHNMTAPNYTTPEQNILKPHQITTTIQNYTKLYQITPTHTKTIPKPHHKTPYYTRQHQTTHNHTTPNQTQTKPDNTKPYQTTLNHTKPHKPHQITQCEIMSNQKTMPNHTKTTTNNTKPHQTMYTLTHTYL
jgi:hypothetical protein